VIERRQQELELLREAYGAVQADPEITWVTISNFPLPEGWSHTTAKVMVLVPAGYPVTPPDNFYLEPGVTLARGVQPGNASPGQSVNGSPWTTFSYHVEPGTWHPSAQIGRGHDLFTYCQGITARLREAT
jgi:hypothetical protein